MSKRSVDETVIVDGMLPKSWKCPHCGEGKEQSRDRCSQCKMEWLEMEIDE